MLALYHFGPVSNSLTPLLCLKEKGLEFEDRWLNSGKFHGFQDTGGRAAVPYLLVFKVKD